MTPSPQCADFIKSYEQCRLKAYMPTQDDAPTIGWGSTGPDIHLGMTWTQAQADQRFTRDLAAFGAKVTDLLHGATTQHQFDAMVSLAYNIGITAFAGSTVLHKHNAGDHAGAADAFLMWSKQKGAVLAGLLRRRKSEREMYLSCAS